MDPEPGRTSIKSSSTDVGRKVPVTSELPDCELEDPFSLSGPSIAFFGLIIALISIGLPFAAVLTDRPPSGSTFIPTALEGDGSTPNSTISFTRSGQSGRRNPRRESK